MIAAALALSLLIGASLGLLGGGGSLMTVPILTYVLGMGAGEAIATSLFVVGATSAIGVVTHARAGRIQWRTGALFGAAAMAGAFAGGRAAAHVPGRALMAAFAGMMVATAFAMLRGRRALVAPRPGPLPVGKVLATGAAVGAATAAVGAGGGFLVVPALVLLGRLPVEIAVGTSLLVIAMNSFAGLAGHLGHVDLRWGVAIAIAATAAMGCIAGSALAGRVRPERLRRGFGVFILAMAAFILADQLGAW